MTPRSGSSTMRWSLLTMAGLAAGVLAALLLGEPLEAVVGMILITPALTCLVGAILGAGQWLGAKSPEDERPKNRAQWQPASQPREARERGGDGRCGRTAWDETGQHGDSPEAAGEGSEREGYAAQGAAEDQGIERNRRANESGGQRPWQPQGPQEHRAGQQQASEQQE